MNNIELVKEINGQAYTTSRLIAEKFGKQHKNVIRDIENLLVSSASRVNFIETTYKSKRGNVKEYLVSQDGLTLYLFNIQGYVQEKMEYINEFNRMKQLITDLQLGKPEAILSLLTWKNSNMETTIRKYINGSNVLNILPAIAEECKNQIMNGEMKLEILTTAIRTTKELRDNEPNIGYRELYTQAIDKASEIRDKILIGRIGGLTSSNNNLTSKCNRLQNKAYIEEDFLNAIDEFCNDADFKVASLTLRNYVCFIANNDINNNYFYKNEENVYNTVYRNVISNYGNLFLPKANIVKKAGYKSILQYYYFNNGINLINRFVSYAEQWAINLGYTKIK